METKQCTRCGKVKPLTDFYLRNNIPRAECKECLIRINNKKPLNIPKCSCCGILLRNTKNHNTAKGDKCTRCAEHKPVVKDKCIMCGDHIKNAKENYSMRGNFCARCDAICASRAMTVSVEDISSHMISIIQQWSRSYSGIPHSEYARLLGISETRLRTIIRGVDNSGGQETIG